MISVQVSFFFFFQAEDGIRDPLVTGVQTCALPIAAAAPAIYFDPVSGTGAILKNSNFSLVTPDNPAKAGDVVLIYLTGMGQTTPSLQTGNLQPGTALNNTVQPTVTIGGQNAAIVYSIA